MNKRYMDFVPAKVNKPVSRHTERAVYKTVSAVDVAKKAGVSQGAPKAPSLETTTVATSVVREVRLGSVEDLSQKFVRRDVPKRPLGQGNGVPHANLRNAPMAHDPRAGEVAGGAQKVEPQKKSPFINQGKVAKRPLSKNAHTPKTNENINPQPTKSTEPVTVIEKPKKESHVKAVVTIIITIILGAAAGTIAFLLLPK